jgi:ectoine hydroxylase-related dioxygenase (phytanoyl-CoA dioxygenase family)
MALPRFPATASADEVAAGLAAHGCAIVDELAPPELCDRVERELRPWIDRTRTGADDFTGRTTRRTGALLARSTSVVDMVAHPLVLAIVEQALAPTTAFQLHLTQAITIGPGSPAQQLHRDQWCFDFHPFPVEMNVEVSSIWALTDFTEANGATRVVPDSHRTTGMPYMDADTEPAVIARGSLVLYLGSTVHGGGANGSDRERTGVNVDYTLGWLRQEENQYLSVPREVASTLPERVQRLMGYGMGCYALGYIDDVRDPINALRQGGDGESSFAVR